MDRNEKKELREFIGEHINVSGARLSDDEADRLRTFIENYDSYRGQSKTRNESHVGFSSDGKYTAWEEWTDTFTDDIGIRRDYSWRDDDGGARESSEDIKDARGILNWLNEHG